MSVKDEKATGRKKPAVGTTNTKPPAKNAKKPAVKKSKAETVEKAAT